MSLRSGGFEQVVHVLYAHREVGLAMLTKWDGRVRVGGVTDQPDGRGRREVSGVPGRGVVHGNGRGEPLR